MDLFCILILKNLKQTPKCKTRLALNLITGALAIIVPLFTTGVVDKPICLSRPSPSSVQLLVDATCQ